MQNNECSVAKTKGLAFKIAFACGISCVVFLCGLLTWKMQHIIQSSDDIFCWVTSTVPHMMKVPPVMNRMTSCLQLSVVSVPILIFFSCCFWKLFHFLCDLHCPGLCLTALCQILFFSLLFHFIPALFWRLVPLVAFFLFYFLSLFNLVIVMIEFTCTLIHACFLSVLVFLPHVPGFYWS